MAEQEKDGEADDAIDLETTSPHPVDKKVEIETRESEEEIEADDDHGMQIADDDDDDSEDVDESDEVVDDSDIGFVEHIEEETISDSETPANRVHQDELAAEVSGKDTIPVAKDPDAQARQDARKIRQLKQKREEEELQRQLGMMPKRKRKLFEKMRYSNQQKENEAAKLRAKRRRLEQS